jgi:hypothetical protein
MLRHAVFAFSPHHVLYVQPTMTKRIQKGVGGSDFIGLVARAYDCRIAQPPAENPAVFFASGSASGWFGRLARVYQRRMAETGGFLLRLIYPRMQVLRTS